MIGWWISRGPSAGPQTSAAASPVDCQQCHPQVVDDWQHSRHALAWVDPVFQSQVTLMGGSVDCMGCHAPAPVSTAGYGGLPSVRDHDREMGVNCVACHPSGPEADADRTANCWRPDWTSESQTCGHCHRALLDDWLVSPARGQGQSCASCHFQPAGHRLQAHVAGSPVSLSARLTDTQIVITVTNHVAGHAYPGERHNRVMFLDIEQYAADERIVKQERVVIKGISPFRGETTSDHIQPGKPYRCELPRAPDVARAKVRLKLKRYAWQTDAEAQDVATWATGNTVAVD